MKNWRSYLLLLMWLLLGIQGGIFVRSLARGQWAVAAYVAALVLLFHVRSLVRLHRLQTLPEDS